ncbi:MAG: nuclear transport factor 2 family protein, partial [Actinobacteria bacterium]|nr:nuclear transport factor 2 family protein [Actinomycetota bacterium]
AIAAADREVLARLLPDDYTIWSHRRFASWDSPLDRAAYFASFESLSDLRIRANMRHDHALRISPAAGVWVATNYGTLDGGDYEIPMVVVYTHDGHRAHAVEVFDLDQLDAALARYEELTAGATTTPGIENAATRSMDRFRAAWEARDWVRVAAEFAPGFRQLDRRKMMRVDVDRDPFLESLRQAIELTSSRFAPEVVATRGERLALCRWLWSGTGEVFGPSEIEFLEVVQVDADGHQDLNVTFDLDDLDAAYAELDRRFAGAEAAPCVRTQQTILRALETHDWELLGSMLTPDFVLEDHRPLGAGRLSRDEYVAWTRALIELRPDAIPRTDHVLATSGGAMLVVAHWEGTQEAGTFDIPSVRVIETTNDGRNRRWDLYGLDQLDAARARFDAIDASMATDPLAALWRPNAATAAMDRAEAAYAARDWVAMRAAAAPDVKIEDRRRHVLVSEDVDQWIADRQRSSRAGSRFQRRLVGTAGDRLALERVLVTGGPPEGPFEIEYLWLIEVDDAGRLAAGIGFDVDDWRAAGREAAARWFAHDAMAAAGVGPMFNLVESYNDRRIGREPFADDFVVDDHRRTGTGRLEGVEAYAESV